jgi:hypothetical protein
VKRLPRVVVREQYGRTTYQHLNEKLLTPVLSVPLPSNQGRCRVTLSKDGAVKLCLVHVMVLEAFVCVRPCVESQGCHNDNDPFNNALSNLRWDTRLGNEKDKIAHGTLARGERNGHAKLSEDDVTAIRLRLADGETQLAIAKDYGVSRSSILHIHVGSTWRHIAA